MSLLRFQSDFILLWCCIRSMCCMFSDSFSDLKVTVTYYYDPSLDDGYEVIPHRCTVMKSFPDNHNFKMKMLIDLLSLFCYFSETTSACPVNLLLHFIQIYLNSWNVKSFTSLVWTFFSFYLWKCNSHLIAYLSSSGQQQMTLLALTMVSQRQRRKELEICRINERICIFTFNSSNFSKNKNRTNFKYLASQALNYNIFHLVTFSSRKQETN